MRNGGGSLGGKVTRQQAKETSTAAGVLGSSSSSKSLPGGVDRGVGQDPHHFLHPSSSISSSRKEGDKESRGRSSKRKEEGEGHLQGEEEDQDKKPAPTSSHSALAGLLQLQKAKELLDSAASDSNNSKMMQRGGREEETDYSSSRNLQVTGGGGMRGLSSISSFLPTKRRLHEMTSGDSRGGDVISNLATPSFWAQAQAQMEQNKALASHLPLHQQQQLLFQQQYLQQQQQQAAAQAAAISSLLANSSGIPTTSTAPHLSHHLPISSGLSGPRGWPPGAWPAASSMIPPARPNGSTISSSTSSGSTSNPSSASSSATSFQELMTSAASPEAMLLKQASASTAEALLLHHSLHHQHNHHCPSTCGSSSGSNGGPMSSSDFRTMMEKFRQGDAANTNNQNGSSSSLYHRGNGLEGSSQQEEEGSTYMGNGSDGDSDTGTTSSTFGPRSTAVLGESLRKSQETRNNNLENIPQEVMAALDAKLSVIPAWDIRITREKLAQLGGVVMVGSSPVLSSGERSENVHNYAPKNFHIKCQYCLKPFNGKNALRNFELHAIFWELYQAHPALALSSTRQDPEVEREHRAVYPCNSISRDVIIFMESKKPVLCNNQKKVWKLQGSLHHNTALFRGRAYIQLPPGRSWESCQLADPSSAEQVLCCRSSKSLEQYDTLRSSKSVEQYDTLRSHVFTWHDSGIFTSCTHCGRIYQNTRAFLAHGCVKKGYDKDETLIASCAQHTMTLLDASPDFAKLYFQMAKLPGEKKDEVFERVGKKMKGSNGSGNAGGGLGTTQI